MKMLPPIWLLLLLAAMAVPAFAQDDDLFGEEPAKEEAAGDDLFGASGDAKAPAEEAAADAAAPGAEGAPADDSGTELEGDLFETETETAQPAPEESNDKEQAAPGAIDAAPLAPARSLHTQAEIKAELIRRNGQIATGLTRFIDLNKQAAKKAVEEGNQDVLMPILREYGPAVIRTKQLWLTVVGNPAKYDTWLGSADYWRAWVAFHHSWQSLYGYIDRFAAVDLGLANQLTDALAPLGTSFQDYSEWVDEWDRELGNDHYAFSRGDANLNELKAQQVHAEEDAAAETTKAAEDQRMEEEDQGAPSEVEEAQQGTEAADREELLEGEQEADAAADAAEGDDDLFGGATAEDEKTPAPKEAPTDEAPAPTEQDDLFGAADEEQPAKDEADSEQQETPTEEKPATEEEAGDDLFGEAAADADEAPKDEAPQEEAAPKESEEEEAADLFGEG